MKKLLLLGLVLLVVACQKEPKIDYAVISGKIENPKGKTVAITKGRETIKEIELKEDGTFTDTLKVESGYYNLDHGREIAYMYLEQGDHINISLNTDEFDESITYTGIGSENNNFLASKFLNEEKFDLDFTKIYAMNENDFTSSMSEVKSSKEEFLKANNSISAELRSLEEKSIYYDYLISLQNYGSAHAYYTKKPDFEPSNDFLEPLKAVNYNNQEDYTQIDSYKRLVQNYYMTKISESENPADVFAEINKNTFSELKNDLAENLRYYIAPSNEHNKAYYDGIMAMSSNDEDFRDAVTMKYHKVKKLAKGMPSPEFINYENHKGGTTSLKDLKGKYVYVDVWATWCGPCIMEIPSLKEIEKKYHDSNIVFVSTSIDRAKDHITWVEMVKEKELGGVQLMADNDWKSKFVQDYAIEGIPRFILIDPDGNIVSADAPRPSNPKLVELFEELKI